MSRAKQYTKSSKKEDNYFIISLEKKKKLPDIGWSENFA